MGSASDHPLCISNKQDGLDKFDYSEAPLVLQGLFSKRIILIQIK